MNNPIARRADNAIADVLGRLPSDHVDAAWTLAPMIVQIYAEAGVGPLDPAFTTIVKRRVRSGLANARRAVRIRLTATDRAVFLMESVNERRVMEPIIGDETVPLPTLRMQTFRARPVATSRTRATADTMYDALVERLGRPDGLAGLFIDRKSLRRSVAVATRTIGEARAFLTSHGPSAVVVGSPMNPLARAMVLAARELSIPTIYLPHAPAANQPWYEDLATDYAGLRGVGEVDFYAELGAPREGLTTVGLPYLADAEPPVINPDLPTVFAPSPIAAPLFRKLIDTVAAGAGSNVLVSPHPRQSVAVLRTQMPRSWKFASDISTAELLRSGHPRVIVHNSGVALEALRLGIPAIHVELTGSPSTYVMYDSGAVTVAGSAEELRDLCGTVVTDDDRKKLISVASEWSSPIGEASVAAGRALVDRAIDEGPRPAPLLDHWGRRER